MTFKGSVGCFVCLLAVLLFAQPVPAQADRGKAELAVAGGKIVVDYGRPLLQGRDPLTWQADGSYWRMGSNEMTTLTTPVGLMFGATRIPKGEYGLWLLKLSAGTYELVFNSQTTGMGMSHDKSKDVAVVPIKKEEIANPVETLTIELKNAPNGGTFAVTWGTARLSTDFQVVR
jgi:hypothetical protein